MKQPPTTVMLLVMTFACWTLNLRSQVDLKAVPKRPIVMANHYFNTATFPSTNLTQLLPGPVFNSYVKRSNSVVPPSSQAICARSMDGESHPAYEFDAIGSVILTSDRWYVCAADRRWKVIQLSEF